MSSYLVTSQQGGAASRTGKHAPGRNEGPPALLVKATGCSITSQFPESHQQPRSTYKETEEQSFVGNGPAVFTNWWWSKEHSPVLLGFQLFPRHLLLQPPHKWLSGHSTSYLFNNLASPAGSSRTIIFAGQKKKQPTHIDSGQGDSDWTRCPAHNKQGNMRTITGGRPESWIQIPNSPPFVMGSWESCLTSFRRISPPEKWYLYYLTPRIAPTGKYDNTGTTLKYILLHTVSTP